MIKVCFLACDTPLASRTNTLSCEFLFCSLRAALSPDRPAPTTTTSNWSSLIPAAGWWNSQRECVAQANITPRLSCRETATPRMVKVRLYYFNALRPDNADHCDCRGRYSDQSRQKKLRHSQTRLPCAWLPLQEFYRISMGRMVLFLAYVFRTS